MTDAAAEREALGRVALRNMRLRSAMENAIRNLEASELCASPRIQHVIRTLQEAIDRE